MLQLALGLASTRVVAFAATALGIALSTVPLFGVHGVESALVLGATLPPLVAAVAAQLVGTARRASEPREAIDLASGAVGTGLALLALPVLVLALNALRVKNCAPLEGLAFIVLGPGFAVVLASLVGTLFGVSALRSALATTLAGLVVLGTTLLALVRLWATPAVFAYGHFFGYLPGSLYDEIVPIPEPLVVLRIVSSLLALGLCAILHACYDPAARRLAARPRPNRTSLAMAGLVALASGPATELAGPSLGLSTRVESIVDALGATHPSKRCLLVVPRELPRERRERLGRDCDFRVTQMERFFGVSEREPVRVYLFRSPEEKRARMGAAGTNIAKPWRHEVYLQASGWPHPVLGHEIAHVVAGHVAPGPLRLSGRFGGLWPDAALVEGVAVAAAWAESSQGGLTPHESAHAMIELGIGPPLAEIFGAGFFGQQKGLAYTLSGSLLRWIADTQGQAALRRVYREGDIERALETSLAELESEWKTYVVATPLPEAARALAELRFSGASVLSSVCPHQVAALRQTLAGELTAGDDEHATETCTRILAMDDAHAQTRATFAALLARAGDTTRASHELATLTAGAPKALVAATRHALADESWRRGRLAQALAEYRSLLSGPTGRDDLRLLQVKALALEGTPRETALLFDLLVGEPGRRPDGASAVHFARELRAERSDGLAHYLEARQLFAPERFEAAARLLADARALGLPSTALELEALRVEAMARHATGDFSGARALFHVLHARGDAALRTEAADWLARIRFEQWISAPGRP